MTESEERQAVIAEAHTWCIYVLADPRDGLVRYVGFTVNAKKRLKQHIYHARSGQNRWPSGNWIRKLLAAGVEPAMQIIETGSGDWTGREQFHIARLRSAGCDLLNVNDGGHFNPPPEARKRAAEKLRTRVFTPEHRRKISEAGIGRKRPDTAERNKLMADSLKGKPLRISDEERDRRRQFGKLVGRENARKRWSISEAKMAEVKERASEQMRLQWQARSPEARRQIAIKSVETRRRNG